MIPYFFGQTFLLSCRKKLTAQPEKYFFPVGQ